MLLRTYKDTGTLGSTAQTNQEVTSSDSLLLREVSANQSWEARAVVRNKFGDKICDEARPWSENAER